MDRWKRRGGKSQRREKKKREDQRRERVRRKKMQVRKGRKVSKHCVFPMICGSGGSKSRLAKAGGAEPPGQMRDELLHAVVSRSTFGSQNVQSTSCSDMFGRLLEVEMSKKCTPLWREARFEVKSKNKLKGREHFWTFGCRFAWQAQGILHLAKSEKNVRVLEQFQLQPPLHYSTLHYTTLHYNYNYNFITLH